MKLHLPKTCTSSCKTLWGLVVTMAFFSALNVFLPQGNMLPVQQLPASKEVLALASIAVTLIVYGGLGFAGWKLARKIGFPDIWDRRVTNNQRFLRPLPAGAATAGLFILIDLGLSHFTEFEPLPHPPFPTSLVASLVAGIGEELIFRLFFISFWVWLISFVILNRKHQNKVFWFVSVLSALVFAFSHLPSLMMLYNFESLTEIPGVLLAEIIILNSVLSLLAADYLRKYGFLAAAGIHFWTDIFWHVVYGAF
jgi:membrane protease YdiL (CAAX protease family)